MHPHRPRFTFSKVGETWSFSIWTFFRTVGYYLNGQIDQIAVGGFGGSSLMGKYAVASDVAQSPSQEINQPMVAVLYPVMSRLQNNLPELRTVYLNALIAPVAFWTQSLIDTAICRTIAEVLFLPGLFHAVHRIAGVSLRQYAE